MAEPPNDPHWRVARGCSPEARVTWPCAPWGFGRRADLAARARHPPRPDLAYDVLAVPMFGLNMIRLHQKINPERWYYHADR